MPRSNRLLAKRKLDESRTHMSWVAHHLDWCIATYKDAHPEWAKKFYVLLQIAAELDKALAQANAEL